MAKKVTKRPAKSAAAAAPAKKTSATAKKPAAAKKTKASKKPAARPATARKGGTKRQAFGDQMNAREAVVGLLESPLVAEVIAAGAAAALAALTQQALAKKSGNGTASALKQAAKAAAGAMGTRLTTEFGEIVSSAKNGPRESK
ncbi:hypothetical protein H8M03_01950 [Sphingomonas sabuli]|uniref:Uncharacterized protein n=1 Tax=Sphingomonas sabuli TaxID=2764186 RepID=A0A7G9L3E8_9SPHN|nr:hypothetical protein [Sphingomonas sabuli]QNM83147.1 hypothetical protein H8M03_01950 [Sphingomonas sabuli]